MLVEACSLLAGGQEHVDGVVVGQGHLSVVAGGGGVDSARAMEPVWRLCADKTWYLEQCAHFEFVTKTHCWKINL